MGLPQLCTERQTRACFFRQRYGDGAVPRRVFDRVVHQYGGELPELRRVALQDDVCFNARRFQAYPFFIGERFKGQADAVNKVAELNRRERWGVFASSDLARKTRSSTSRFMRCASACVLSIHWRCDLHGGLAVFLQYARVRQDHGQGRFQFMRGVGHKPPLLQKGALHRLSAHLDR